MMFPPGSAIHAKLPVGISTGGTNFLPPSELGLVQIQLQIVDLNVKRDVIVRLVAQRSDLAVNAAAAAGIDHCRWAGLLYLPAKQT